MGAADSGGCELHEVAASLGGGRAPARAFIEWFLCEARFEALDGFMRRSFASVEMLERSTALSYRYRVKRSGDGSADQGGTIEVTIPSGVSSGDTVTVAAPDGRHIAVEVPRGVFPGEKIRVAVSNEPRKQFDEGKLSLSRVFGELEDNKAAAGISEYSVGQTTLEQIFVQFASSQENPENAANPIPDN